MEGQRKPKKPKLIPTTGNHVNVQGLRANEASLKARSKQDVNTDALKLKTFTWDE